MRARCGSLAVDFMSGGTTCVITCAAGPFSFSAHAQRLLVAYLYRAYFLTASSVYSPKSGFDRKMCFDTSRNSVGLAGTHVVTLRLPHTG